MIKFRGFKVRRNYTVDRIQLTPDTYFHNSFMAKLFIGIALVVMLATAALSFLAKGNIDKLQTSLKDTKAKQALAEGQAKTAKNEEEKAKKEAKEANDKADTATKLAADKSKEADDAKKDSQEKQLVLDSQDKGTRRLEGEDRHKAPVAPIPWLSQPFKARSPN